jgi:hypothetical protein
MSEPNIQINYMYRDGANYKELGSVVFANPSMLTAGEVERRLREACDCGENFIAGQVELPELFHWVLGNYPLDEETDHCWHELVVVSDVEDETTDERCIEDFIDQFSMASALGWDVFDPAEREAGW